MSNYASEFTVSKVFSSNMVLQRDEKIRIWGWAPEEQNGRTVEACFMNLNGSGVINDGYWTITLNGTLPAYAKTGESLVVKGADVSYTFENVLVGDVYMVIGQSNIRYPVEAAIHESPEGYPGKDCVITDDEYIRLNRSSIHDADGNDIYPPRGTTELCHDVRHGRQWMLPSEDALNFSAIGYFAAKQIVAKTNNQIPIGLIEIDADGQALNAFMPNELADELGTDTFVDGIYKGMWHIDLVPSRYVYNHFIYPYQNYSICGIIWYQGESDFNSVNCPVFAKNYTAFINELRKRFDMTNRDFPVYIVEIPACFQRPEDWPDGEMWGYIDMGNIRCEMGRIPNMLSNSYIAASSDLWLNKHYWNNLHPYCKWPQSERIANIMLANKYGIGELEKVAGPQMTAVEYRGDTAIVSYKYVGEGLTSANSSDISGFQVKVKDEWVEPTAVNNCGNTVTLSADSEITAVSYNAVTTNYFPDYVNLCSGEGIPAIAFVDYKF